MTDQSESTPKREDHLASCLMAFQFLTRIPVSSPGVITDNAAGRSLLYYPVVGLVLTVLLALIASVMSGLSPENYGVQAVVILVVWVLLTGGLHLDGLADSADAWVGGFGDRERTLAIMKDPYAGPAAVFVMILLLLGKWVFIQALIEQGVMEWLMAPIIARVFMVHLLTATPYAREGGFGEVLSQHCSKQDAKHLLIFALIAALFVMDFVALAIVLIAYFALRWLMMERLGGVTGDTAGATVEIIEWVFLLALLL